MERCKNCGTIIAFGAIKEGEFTFCSKNCADFFKMEQNGFCESCKNETTDKSPGNLYTWNGVGTSWGAFSKSKCPTCNSVILQKWFYFGLPIIPLGKYRVLQRPHLGSKVKFLARKLKTTQ
jgi:endogenous inhibitor of DNA gyrase (YacG/DUF329 family)